MSKKILFAKVKIEGEEKVIFCNELDKTDYGSKYKGHLTCINGCKARLKFTQKKNNNKFFSTWNKEGKLHNEDCPYYVEYTGVKGRKKLNAYYKNIELTDEAIFDRIKRKYSDLHKNYTGNEYPIPETGSVEVQNTGEEIVLTGKDSLTGEENSSGAYIRHKDAEFVTLDDIGRILSVYGKIKNVYINDNNDGTKFAYINYDTKNTTVNILFSEVFYSSEYSNGLDEFERYIEKIKKMIETSVVPLEAIAYGEITKKKQVKSGVNISVNNPKRILINGMSYNEILYKI